MFILKRKAIPELRRAYKSRKMLNPLLPLLGKGKGRDDDEDFENDTENNDLPTKLFGGTDDNDVYTSHNHIYFKTEVTDESIDKLGREIDSLVYKIQQMAKKSTYGTFTANPIYLHITTNGGSLLAGFLAYDKIRGAAIPINTIIEGSVASAGSIMSIAGANRYMTANSHLLIHQLRSFIAGTFESLVDDHKNCRAFMKRMVNLYYEHSGGKMSKKKIREYLKHDIFWSFEESLQNGLVDGIWPKPSSD
jgi:ATP-dependent protease ClpP protease subunit